MPTADDLPELDLPLPPDGWRAHVTEWAESLDLSLTRLAVGLVVLAAVALVGWRLLTPSEPAEMQLPMVATGADSPAPGPTPSDGHSPETDGTEADSAGTDADPGSTPGPDGPAPGRTDTGTPGTEVVVHIAGSVREPGVQRLEPPARLIDAVDAAGGAAEGADLSRVNLAGELTDGQHIYVPAVDEEPPELVSGADNTAPGAASGPTGDGTGSEGALVNVNTAGLTQLEALPGVGPAIGQAILDHRDQNGPFTSVDELTAVRGIGDAKLEGLRDHATVG